MDLNGKKVLVAGFGVTGEAVCRFLLSQGAAVTISEKKSASELSENLKFWSSQGVTFETGGHRTESFLDADLIVPSPGVPHIPPLRKAQAQGITILSEIELAYRFLKGKIVGVTGSNGKSTVVTLSHKILSQGGLPAHLAGNIGTPLVGFVDSSADSDIYVTELSSFQLAHTDRFRPFISVFLNISRDHIDWHESFNNYFADKKRIISSQTEKDIAILNRDDSRVWRLKDAGPYRVYAFSLGRRVAPGCFRRNGEIILCDEGEIKLMNCRQVPLPGEHNLANVMAAALIGHIFQVAVPRIKDSISSFKGLEHRLEKVLSFQGIDFYNDSKATNVDATLNAIQSFQGNIILILGGRDKGGDFQLLKDAIQTRVKRIVLLGEARKTIQQALEGSVPMDVVDDIPSAVKRSFQTAGPGDTVLLAPACTSFDMFQSFEHRGKVFKQEVFALKDRLG